MAVLENRIRSSYPRWFRGHRGAVARPLLRWLARWSGLDAAEAFLQRHVDRRDFDFVRAALDFMQARCVVDDAALARIPARGRLLIVANHPTGASDALALLDAVGRVRRDVRVVANDWLGLIEPLAGLLLPVRVFGGRAAARDLRAIERALHAEQCVIVFPAGEVSRLGPRGVRDGRWQRGIVRFARRSDAPVLPVHVRARNSALFYAASTLFKPAGTALLARETMRSRTRDVRLSIGDPRMLPADRAADLVLCELRRDVYALGRLSRAPRDADVASVAMPADAPLIGAVDTDLLHAGIAGMSLLGHTIDGRQIRAGRLEHDAPLLREIGRLRELTFRAVGEGTGRALDLDAYDAWYEHIVLWDAPNARIVGAYRVAHGLRVLAERGLAGFYTASLFRYSDAAIPRIAQGVELGRSFVVPDCWGSRSIDYLWQGIGAWLQRHPAIRYLFGAVSISAALPLEAREQIVAYYARYYGQPGEVQSRRPFAFRAAPPVFADVDADVAFRMLKDNLGALGATLPMLYKQYTELCEPGGACFLAFGVDPDFRDAVDGLIQVDLQRLRERKRERYLRATPSPVGEAA